MARNDDRKTTSGSGRPKYRASDNDDERAPIPPDQRGDVKSDSRSEARGRARETAGDNARGTRAAPTGPEGNDRTRGRPAGDEFDRDLERDKRHGRD
jgi:hypothetical protein